MHAFFDEAQVEIALVEMFKGLGYEYAFGPDIACDGPRPERTSYADVVVFINELPIAVAELKNPADETATVKRAFNQLQTYKQDIPALFTYNEILIVADGFDARHGTITSDWDRFMPWRTIDGTEIAPPTVPQLDVLIARRISRRGPRRPCLNRRRYSARIGRGCPREPTHVSDSFPLSSPSVRIRTSPIIVTNRPFPSNRRPEPAPWTVEHGGSALARNLPSDNDLRTVFRRRRRVSARRIEWRENQGQCVRTSPGGGDGRR